MYHDDASATSDLIALSPQTLYRGLYVRIARKLGVDPSYVSRVARGERQSPEVETALSQEIGQITRKLGAAAGQSRNSQKPIQKKRLKSFITEEQDSVRKQWLGYIQEDPNIRRIKLSGRQRAAPVTPLVKEAIKSMQFSLKEIAVRPMNAAMRHCKERRQQGYTPTTLLEEYNLIRRCIYNLAEQKLKELDPQMLVRDLSQLGEVLDFQTQIAIRGFLGHA